MQQDIASNHVVEVNNFLTFNNERINKEIYICILIYIPFKDY